MKRIGIIPPTPKRESDPAVEKNLVDTKSKMHAGTIKILSQNARELKVKETDKTRQQSLENDGLRVFRFTNEEVVETLKSN